MRSGNAPLDQRGVSIEDLNKEKNGLSVSSYVVPYHLGSEVPRFLGEIGAL